MAEKYIGKIRHQPSSVSHTFNNLQRSRSVTNILEQEPKPQSVRLLERKLSSSTNLNITSTKEPKNKVAKLIQQFDKSKSTENIYQSIKNLHLSSTSTHRPPPISYNFGKPLIKQETESTKTLTQTVSIPQIQIEPMVYSSLHTNLNNSQNQSIYDTNQLNIPSTDLYRISSTETTSSESMIVSTKPPSSISGEFLNAQLIDTIKSLDDDFYESIDQNKMILSEHINEVYNTEVTYVDTLYVLSNKIPIKIKETCEKDEHLIEIFNKIYKPLFDIIEKLYQFHYEIILPHLESYKRNYYRKDNLWSIIEEHFQTIEDLYKTYYIIYDEYQYELKRLDRSTSLKKIHQAILECKIYLGNLCPITEFNSPNQRLLRYILLMKSSMKNLDENSTEYEHTNFIHDELSRIATRCNEQLFLSSNELNRLKSRVDNKLECFKYQQLIWHGSVKKQSTNKRHLTQIYLILFSQCILVCEESGNKLEIKRQLSIENLIINIIQNKLLSPTTFHSAIGQSSMTNIYYPFRITTLEKSYEFLVDKQSDREIWVNKITQACKDFKSQQSISNIHLSDKQQIGLRAPIWVNILDVTRCQICNNRFGLKLTPSARHHCRSCGRCICGSCSTKKLILQYRQKDGEVRICDQCYSLATGRNRSIISSLKSTRHSNETILFGDFRCHSTNSIIWIDLLEDYQIHVYNGRLDQIEDYSINLPDLRDLILIEETRTFILIGKEKKYKFSIELNHQIFFPKNDSIDDNLKKRHNNTLFYAKLWFDTMQLARSKTYPLWYIRKRDSADSGISAVE